MSRPCAPMYGWACRSGLWLMVAAIVQDWRPANAQCWAGSYDTDLGVGETCVACSAGRYDHDSNPDSACLDCPDDGTYTAGNGTDCPPCAAGRIDHDRRSATACNGCPNGRHTEEGYAPVSGAVPLQCPRCEKGYADVDRDPSTPCETCLPGQWTSTGAWVCLLCRRGEYDADSDSTTDCVGCPEGRSAPLEGSTECTACGDGEYTDFSRTACISCPEGYYDHDIGVAGVELSAATDCELCLSGHYTRVPTGSTECLPCLAGTFAAANGTQTCSVCDVGKYSPDQAESCTDCLPGYADVDQNAQTPCQMCNAGEYAGMRSAECTHCINGTIDNDGDPTTPCLNCDAGTYSLSRQISCIDCGAGLFARTGSANCSSCPRGTFSANRAPTCTACNIGKFAAEESARCAFCIAGRYDHDRLPSTECTLCGRGTHSGRGAAECTACAVGSYDHDSNAGTPCNLCVPGQYDLHALPSGGSYVTTTSTPLERITCNKCKSGRFVGLAGSTVAADCSYCPEDSYSEGGSAECKICPVVQNRQYTYEVSDNSTRKDTATGRFIGATTIVACVCNVGYFAPVAHVDNHWTCARCPNFDACLGGTAERPKGNCIKGYAGDSCQTCADGWFAYEVDCIECPESPGWRLLIFLILILVFSVAMIFVSSELRVSGGQLFKLLIAPIVIILSRAQVLGAIANLGTPWPDFVLEAARYLLHMANVDLPSVVYPECQFDFKEPAAVLLFRLVFNATLFLFICLFIFIVFMWYACLAIDYSPLINGVVACFAILYLLLVRIGFKSIDCTVIDGEMRLDMNLELTCFSGEHWPLVFVGLCIIALYGFIVPYVLWKQMPYGDLQEEDMQRKFGWLYARYRPACYYFEWILLIQKAGFAGITTFFGNANRFWVSWPSLLVLTFGSLLLQLKLQPYVEPQPQIEPTKHISLDVIEEDEEDEESSGDDWDLEEGNEEEEEQQAREEEPLQEEEQDELSGLEDQPPPEPRLESRLRGGGAGSEDSTPEPELEQLQPELEPESELEPEQPGAVEYEMAAFEADQREAEVQSDGPASSGGVKQPPDHQGFGASVPGSVGVDEELAVTDVDGSGVAEEEEAAEAVEAEQQQGGPEAPGPVKVGLGKKGTAWDIVKNARKEKAQKKKKNKKKKTGCCCCCCCCRAEHKSITPFGLPKAAKKAGRRALTKDEELLSSPKDWAGVSCSLLCIRWLQAFRHPISTNALEVHGLNAQLVVLFCALYWQQITETEGELPYDGRYGTPMAAGVVALSAPGMFVMLGLVMVGLIGSRGHAEISRKKKAEKAKMRQLLDDEEEAAAKPLGARVAGIFTNLRRGLSAVKAFQAFKQSATRPASANSSVAGRRAHSVELQDTVKVQSWLSKLADQRRRSSTSTGKPQAMTIDTLNLSVVYELSDIMRGRYQIEVKELLGNGRVTGLQLGVGRRLGMLEQLLPGDRDRVIWLQWRLMEDKTIKAAKITLLEDLAAKKLGLVKAPPVRVPSWAKPPLLRYTFMLKFIAKIFGPLARNNAQYRQTVRDAQFKARDRANQLQAASAFVKLSKKPARTKDRPDSAAVAASAILTAGGGFQRALARARSSSRLGPGASQRSSSRLASAGAAGGFEAQPPSTPKSKNRPRRSRPRKEKGSEVGGESESAPESPRDRSSSRAAGEGREGRSHKSRRSHKGSKREKESKSGPDEKDGEGGASLFGVAP